MIARWLAAKVRRAWKDDGGFCALWVECTYVEPFGFPEWTVRIQPVGGADDFEVARHRSLIVALWRAWRAA